MVLAVCAVVLGVAIIGFISGGGKPVAPDKKKPVVLRSNTPALRTEKIREELEAAKNYEPPSSLDKTRSTIESHRRRYEGNTDAPDAPALLEAMGNLYMMRMGDYGMAAYCYQEILHRYPDWNRRRAYVGLATAYSKMGDLENEMRIYNEMMKEYPKDSVEYKWAADKTGEEPWEGPDVILPGSPEEAELIKETEEAFVAARQEAVEDNEENEGETSAEADTEVVEGEPAP